MFKRLLLFLGLVAVPVMAQTTVHFPAEETNNTFLGTNTFNGQVTFNGLANGTQATFNTAVASVNKVLSVIAPPYNAKCDVTGGTNLTITSGVTSGFAFVSADVGKTLTGVTAANPTYTAYTGTIQSVSGGNATVSGSPTITLQRFTYGTDDHNAIQSAFNDAYSTTICAQGCSVQFPAGSCLTSTITWEGQNFFGAGRSVTNIQSQPGQDVFQVPDSAVALLSGFKVRDFNINMDVSVNASATAGGGNNTFPNRVAGTNQGLNLYGSGSLASIQAISPLAPEAGVGLCGGHGMSTTSGGSQVTMTCPSDPFSMNLTIDPALVVGAPITVTGAGSGGALYTGTITSVASGCAGQAVNCVINVTPTTPTQVTNATGTYLNANTPPWYVGNAGFALQCSNGNVGFCAANITGTWENVSFNQVNAPDGRLFMNHAAAIFSQLAPYGSTFTNVYSLWLDFGYVEAAPYSGRIFTADTSRFYGLDLSDRHPLVIYNGNDRTFINTNLYSEMPGDLGVFFLTNGCQYYQAAGQTIFQSLYMEGNASISGEYSRFCTNSYQVAAANYGGGVTSIGTVEFDGTGTNWDGGVSGTPILRGNHNHFRNTQNNFFVDNGWGNTTLVGLQGGTPNYMGREYNPSPRPYRDALNKLDGATLLSGNSAASFLTESDLMTTCADWAFPNNPANSTTATCTVDPTGTEITRTYMQSAGPTTAIDFFNNGGSPNIWSGSSRVFGRNVPQTKTTVYVLGECPGVSGSCTATFAVKAWNGNTQDKGVSGAVTFGPSWTVQSLQADMTTWPAGDVLDFSFGSWTNTGTNYNVAWIGVQPWPADLAPHVLLDYPSLTATSQAGAVTNMQARDQIWSSNLSAAVDTTSPTGYSVSVTANTFMQDYQGSVTFPGGKTFPAAYGTETFTVEAPPVWTDTLNGSLTSTATTCVLTNGALSSWQANGFFIVDQEILGYSGTPSVGTTSFTCTRGNFGTLAQAHNNGATVASIATGQWITKCNSLDVSNGRGNSQPIYGSWTQVLQAFAGQGCSGLTPQFNLAALNAPTGQVVKIANLQLVSLAGVQPAPTAAGQCQTSVALSGSAWFAWQNVGSCTAGVSPITVTVSAFNAAPNTCYNLAGSASWTQSTGTPSPTTTTMTGLTTSMSPHYDPTTEITQVVGWGAINGMTLNLRASAANTLSSSVCNVTASSINQGGFTANIEP